MHFTFYSQLCNAQYYLHMLFFEVRDTLFFSFELHKFGDLVQDPFLYLKLTLQQAAAIVQSQARTQHISTDTV